MSISYRSVLLAALLAATALAVGAAAPSTALASSTRIVDDDFGTPSACRGAAYATIGDAVASFSPGQSGAIRVCPGTYSGNTEIAGLGKIKIVGMPGAILTTTVNDSVLIIINTKRLVIRGFTFDGAGYNSGGLLLFEDSSGVVTKNVFLNASSSFGVNSSTINTSVTLKVFKNTYTGVAGGVLAVAAGGKLAAKISSNTVTGAITGISVVQSAGSATAAISGNKLQGTVFGIQLQNVAKPKVTRNTVDGFAYGIYLQDVNFARVSRNKINAIGYGIAIFSNSLSANSNKVQKNTVTLAGNSTLGIVIMASASASANLNQIKANKILDVGNIYTGTGAIYLATSGAPVDKTQIVGNILTNIDTPYTHSGDTNTVIKRNKCKPASPCVTP